MQTQTRRRMWRLIRAYIVSIGNRIKVQNKLDTPKMTNELDRHTTVEESTSIQWVKADGHS